MGDLDLVLEPRLSLDTAHSRTQVTMRSTCGAVFWSTAGQSFYGLLNLSSHHLKVLRGFADTKRQRGMQLG